jgi:hypothetical protein
VDDPVIAASFPASRDGSLKEWAAVDAAAPAAVWTADDGTARRVVSRIAPDRGILLHGFPRKRAFDCCGRDKTSTLRHQYGPDPTTVSEQRS